MKKLIFSVLLVQLLFLVACGEKKSAEIVNTQAENSPGIIILSQEQFDNGGLTLGNLEEKPFHATISVNGMIDVPPDNKATVNATLGGYIKKTPPLIGEFVKKGQVLVTLENPEFVKLQQEYMEVKESLSYLEAEYTRQKTLQQENITSQKSFLKAESEFKSANSRYKGLKKQLNMLNISTAQMDLGNGSSVATIYAPISGSVTQMNVNKGTYVSPATPIMEIIDNDHIHLELSVFEKDIMKIEKGQLIHFKIPEASQQTYQAEVYLIGTSIGENRTIDVHGHLNEEGEHNFLTGMFVNAEIITESTTAKALPSEAIIEQDGNFYALRSLENSSNGYSFEPIEIQPGNRSNGFTEIKNMDSFSASDRFLTKGAFDVFRE